MAKQNSKQIRIQGKYRASEKRLGKNVPWLNLSGIWLEESGFHVGDSVRVVIRSGLLIIENVGESSSQKDFESTLNEMKQSLKKLIQ